MCFLIKITRVPWIYEVTGNKDDSTVIRPSKLKLAKILTHVSVGVISNKFTWVNEARLTLVSIVVESSAVLAFFFLP